MKNNWLIVWGTTLVLILPLLNLPPWFAPPEWSKAVVFRGIALLALAGIGWALFSNNTLFARLKEVWRTHKTLLVLLGGYVFALLLSTLFSAEIQRGLLGTPARGGGVLDIILLFTFVPILVAYLSNQDWGIPWKAALITGVLVSVIALFQQFEILSGIFASETFRPGSTLGGPAFLASYLLLLLFPALTFGITSSHLLGKLFYLGIALLFIAVILLGFTRGAYMGLFIGLAWFIGWYPTRYSYRTMARSVILIGALGGIAGFAYLNLAQLPTALQKNSALSTVYNRLQVESLLEARYGTWVVGSQAVVDQPLFGYGYENSYIGLNKHVDTALPGITPVAWWPDRGHNIILDTLLAGGILALVSLGLFLFFLFKKLQQAKSNEDGNVLALHGIQALLLAYLGANLFSFDNFSVQLVLFFAIAWALSVLGKQGVANEAKVSSIVTLGGVLFIPLFLLGFWYISLNPLWVNAKINQAQLQACEPGLAQFSKLNEKTYLHVTTTHLKTQYANMIDMCIQENAQFNTYRTQQYNLLKEITELRPQYAENWIDFGGLATNLGEQAINQGEQAIAQQLFIEAENAFAKAHELSPKRPLLLQQWAIKELVMGNYESAQQKMEQCLELQEHRASCWWWKAIAEVSLGLTEEGHNSLQRAQQEGYNIEGSQQLPQLLRAYAVAGQYELARATADQLLKLRPNIRDQVEALLNSIPR